MIIAILCIAAALLVLGVSFLAMLPVYRRLGDAVHRKPPHDSH